MRNLLRALVDVAAPLVMFFGLAIFFALLMLNWLMGCGDTIYHADGTTHHGECVSLVQLFTPEENPNVQNK